MREKSRDEASKRAESFKQSILHSRQELADAYARFTESVRNINVPDTYLIFGAEVGTKTQQLWETIDTLFDNRGFRPFQSKYGYDLSSAKDLRVEDQLFDGIETVAGLYFIDLHGSSFQDFSPYSIRTPGFVCIGAHGVL